MTESEYQVFKSVGFVLALAVAVGLQRASPHALFAGSWRENGALWTLNVLVLGLVCAGCACTVSRWAESNGFGVLSLASAPLWVAVPVTVVGMDLVSYFWHRANHGAPLLWRFHQVHHSDPQFTASTALRFHPGELLLALPVRLLAVMLLGVPIVGLIAFELIFAFSNFFEHGDIDLPPVLERILPLVFVTPALHRRHHSRENALLNTNYGTIFSFWDRLFSSYAESSSKVRIRPGLPGLEGALGTLDILTLPARGIIRGE